MTESSLGIMCKSLSDREKLQVCAYIDHLPYTPIRQYSEASKNYACIPYEPLCVKSAFFNILFPSVLGKNNLDFFTLPQHNYGFLQCFASLCVCACFCACHTPKGLYVFVTADILLTSLIKIQLLRQATF